MKTSTVLAAIASSLLLPLTPLATRTAAAQLIDVHGLYEGKWSCRGLSFDGKFTIGNKNSFLVITQVDFLLTAHIDFPIAPFGEFFFNGFLIPNVNKLNKQAEGVLLQCGTSEVPSADEGEIGRASISVKPGSSKGSFKMVSISEVVDNDVGPVVTSCKYSYKRVDINPTDILPCGERAALGVSTDPKVRGGKSP